jgi:tetratricopeptide (TPR) repeat protein
MTEESLFAAALEQPAADRQRFLEQACGADTALLGRLRVLLAAHEKAAGVLDRPDATAAHARPEDAVGVVLAGRYKLLEEIGAGGMGTVWMAEQREPVKRLVALKLIKAGMDSQAVLARFEQERQALALMDHPNIAKVLDGGTTERGRPYFVMELVKGLPLTEYCDDRRLSVPERLQLFAQVCAAVQHAHQKGILHRDLKPSNILVTEHDGRPVPKVIDFGLAKALAAAGALTERTLHTAYGTVVGTPLYMSPEQVGINALDVDTRADVYALGVILYELLTGTTPVEKGRFKEAAWEEVKRVIREEEPPRPSLRLSSSEALATLAARRQVEPAQLSRLVRGELDWIVLKALEKDRNRRYETAVGLALDVQRHLAGEVVLAAPPSAGYRLKKFLRKHRGPVTAAALVLLTLLVGIAGTSLGLWRALGAEEEAVGEARRAQSAEQLATHRLTALNKANQETEQALGTTRRAQADTEQALKESEAARAATEDARKRTRAALDTLTDEVVETLLGKQPRLDDGQIHFLRKVQKLHEEFARSRGDTPAAWHDQAWGFAHVARISHMLGELEEAEQAARAAEKLLPGLAKALGEDVGLRELRAAVRDVLAGILSRRPGNAREAEALYRLVIEDEEYLVTKHPDVVRYRHNLGANLLNLGNRLERDPKRQAERESLYRRAQAVLEPLTHHQSQLYLSSCYNNLGTIHSQRFDLEGAEAQYNKALAIRQRLVKERPNNPECLSYLANTHGNLASLMAARNRPDEVERHLRGAVQAQEKVVALFPGVPQYRLRQSFGAIQLAKFLLARKAPDQALAEFDRALTAAYPTSIPAEMEAAFQVLHREGHLGKATALGQLGKHAEAVPEWERLLKLMPRGEAAADVRIRRGLSLVAAGRTAEAVKAADEGVQETAGSPGKKAGVNLYNAACVYSLASGKEEQKKDEYARRAVELLKRAAQAGYRNVEHVKKDPDLDPLREREDFKMFLQSLSQSTRRAVPVDVASHRRRAEP